MKFSDRPEWGSGAAPTRQERAANNKRDLMIAQQAFDDAQVYLNKMRLVGGGRYQMAWSRFLDAEDDLESVKRGGLMNFDRVQAIVHGYYARD
jgi:hypothetical protein